MTQDPHISRRLPQAQIGALVVGIVCLGACIAGGILGNTHSFYRSYLFSYLFWLGIALGSMAIMLVHQLTGGRWGSVIRPIGMTAALTLPALLVLFIPIVIGIHDLYIWAQPAAVAQSPALQHKAPWLNIPFFLTRVLVYFILWSAIALLLSRWSKQADRGEQQALTRTRRLAAAGLIVYELSMSLASVDWIMSRDTDWYSTIFGFMVTVGQALSGMAFMIVFLALLIDRAPLKEKTNRKVLIDLGNLLLTTVVLWSYLAFAQLLVSWMGNSRQEAAWYTQRGLGDFLNGNAWRWIGLALVVFHFFIPFFLLLFRDIKSQFPFLVGVAVLLLVMRLVDQYWLIAPAGMHNGPQWNLSWMDFLMPAGIGGLWIALFIWLLRRRPLALPVAFETGHD